MEVIRLSNYHCMVLPLVCVASRSRQWCLVVDYEVRIDCSHLVDPFSPRTLLSGGEFILFFFPLAVEPSQPNRCASFSGFHMWLSRVKYRDIPKKKLEINSFEVSLI